ncbi:MAG TPA: hypothetical protein VF676_01940 [Flavobacterium sp.]|jgi:antitoxin component YwqK of YwqJK toxin-antitoxin module
MKKVLPVLIVLAINVVSFGQKTMYLDKNWKETAKDSAEYSRVITEQSNHLYAFEDYYKSGKLQFKGHSTTSVEPLNLQGKASWYFENGIVSQQGTFVDNVPTDSLISYYPNGQVKSSAVYKSGKIQTTSVEYFPDGSIAGSTPYVDGELNGTYVKYTKPAQLLQKIDFQNGKMHGQYEFYTSSGTLFNKGNAKNGLKHGLCLDYHYEGELLRSYTIRDGKLHGRYSEYARDKGTLSEGEFQDGIAKSYSSTSGQTNGSIFRKKMKLKNGIEEWKTYRGDALVMESFYKDGLYWGVWKVYSYNGKKLYKTLDFTKNANCKENSVQPSEDTPHLNLSPRFGFSEMFEEQRTCDDVLVGSYEVSIDEHPLYYYEPDIKPADNIKKAGSKQFQSYIDPSSTEAFKVKNSCTSHERYENVSVCSKVISKIAYKVYISKDRALLEQLKKQAQPGNFEVLFYVQQFENRDYDFSKEKRQSRYMAISFDESMKEAFKSKILDYIAVIGVFENEFWNIDDFSGLSAFSAFDEEMGK